MVAVMKMPRSASRRTLAVALAVIAALFVAQGGVIRHLAHTVESRAWQLEQDSIRSVELLARISRDLERERILVDDHITTKDAAEMAAIEVHRGQVLEDLTAAEQLYAPLVELPDEDTEWDAASHLIQRFHRSLDEVTALSRVNRDVEAREAWTRMRNDYETLHNELSKLIAINRAGALDSVHRIQRAERVVENISDATLVAALLAMAWTGLWMSRRITSYERQLETHAGELQSQNRELDAFAGRVAHDLRNALAPLAIFPALLRRSADKPVKILEVCDRVERCSQRTETLIEALLTFSRASQGVKPDESASITRVVEEVVEEAAPLAAQHDVAIEVNELPDLVVRCDAPLLHIVLANLVGNAVKYLHEQPERYVRISARAEGAFCRLDVIDTGPGIPEHARQKIFEPFYRVEGSRASGFGIGLATVRRIVDARGGRVAVESATGAGSRFCVWLQRVPIEAPSPAPLGSLNPLRAG
jgi:signal transduction histidine kinase